MSTAAGGVVVVGAAAAGLAVAEGVRSNGYGGTLTMIGEEAHPPYDRPPLSKQILLGDWEPDRAFLRRSADLDRLGLDLRLGVSATALDVDSREVLLGDGVRVGYDALVIATGVSARWLPNTDDIEGVHVLRTLDDALDLGGDLVAGARLVVIGAGVLGVEVAAVAATRGLAVTVIDPSALPMQRVVGARVGEFVADLHAAHGVDLRCGVGVAKVLAAGGRVTGVETSDGDVVGADVVLVAVGATPAVGWLDGSGLGVGGHAPDEGAGGVICDRRGSAAAGVYAVGDVAAWPAPSGGYSRVEHRLNASEQGRAVARSLVDPDFSPAPSVPYFWSDQYGLKIQCFGLPGPDDDFEVVDGALGDHRFLGRYTRRDVVTAVVGVGMSRRLREWRTRVGHPLPGHGVHDDNTYS